MVTGRPEHAGNGRERAPGYKRAMARLAYAKIKKDPTAHPDAVRAAMGRMLVHGGDGYPAAVPQKNATSVEAIAWHREARTQPGYWNRTQRSLK